MLPTYLIKNRFTLSFISYYLPKVLCDMSPLVCLYNTYVYTGKVERQPGTWRFAWLSELGRGGFMVLQEGGLPVDPC